MTQPTPPKPGWRARLRQMEYERNQATMQANNGTIVVAALANKLGLKNRAEIKAIVDEYMAYMQAKVEDAKAKRENTTQVIESFADPVLMSKVAQLVSGDCDSYDDPGDADSA